MKRFLPYILILVIAVQFLAPFTLGNNLNSQPKIEINKAEAVGITVNATTKANDTSIVVNVNVKWSDTSFRDTYHGALVMLLDGNGNYIDKFDVPLHDTEIDLEQAGILKITNLTPSTPYQIKTSALVTRIPWTNFLGGIAGLVILPTDISESGVPSPEIMPVTTSESGNTTYSDVQSSQRSANTDAFMPVCGIVQGSVAGCAAQLFYYVLFVPTSYIFALSGQFFDTTFHYSVQDKSYRTPFVTEGWGLVRDFCNMFFIFILLYIAFGTILGLHGVNPKEMIVKVVIIGLLINFSLFATQVMIDTSNILARVFYNSDSIKITQAGANGVANATPGLKVGPNGEIPLSAAIVNKINPQNLIISGSQAVVIRDNVSGETGNAEQKNGNLSVGAFILITLLATAVNVVGIITFLSVGLIFVTRVVGLWIAMILSPFVFFTYTVPSLKNTKMVGWEHWWPDTLKLAFLAPIFIFFMYLIIAFLEKGLSLFSSNQTTDGMTFVISIVIPFIFIMVLLIKAKDIAKDMSGELGQSITNGIKAVGGVALGGAALGAAFLGRSTVGAISKSVQNDGARQKNLQLGGNIKSAWKGVGLNPFKAAGAVGKTFSSFGKAGIAGLATGIHAIPKTEVDEHGVKTKTTLGKQMQEADKNFGKKTSSQGTLDSYTEKAGFKDRKWKELSEPEQMEVRKKIDKDKLATQNFGTDLAGVKDDSQRKVINDQIDKAYKDYDDADKSDPTKREAAESALVTATGIGKGKGSADLIKNLNIGGPMGEFVQALRKGSYDIRNISKLQSSSKGMAKTGIGLAAVVASGVRLGLKKGVGIDHGVGQKDFFKDIGNVISDALKDMKVDVKVDGGHGGGGGHAKADAHGGGGHH